MSEAQREVQEPKKIQRPKTTPNGTRMPAGPENGTSTPEKALATTENLTQAEKGAAENLIDENEAKMEASLAAVGVEGGGENKPPVQLPFDERILRNQQQAVINARKQFIERVEAENRPYDGKKLANSATDVRVEQVNEFKITKKDVPKTQKPGKKEGKEKSDSK